MIWILHCDQPLIVIFNAHLLITKYKTQIRVIVNLIWSLLMWQKVII